jgi:hypothetical protein
MSTNCNDIYDNAKEALRGWNSTKSDNTQARISHINDIYKWVSLAKTGRPAWHLHLTNGQPQNELVYLASSKLGEVPDNTTVNAISV